VWGTSEHDCGGRPEVRSATEEEKWWRHHQRLFVVIILVVGYNIINSNSPVTDLTNAPPCARAILQDGLAPVHR
jgi:hypothetical protein